MKKYSNETNENLFSLLLCNAKLRDGQSTKDPEFIDLEIREEKGS